MKPELHPEWYPEAKVICACGNSWTVGATQPEIRTDVCNKCHPFFTGEQRIVDTEGQVDRFMRRLRAREEALREEERRRKARTSPELPVEKLDLNTRILNVLSDAEITKVGQILELMEEKGDEALTDIKGFGLRTLADIKRSLRSRGFVLPGDDAAEDVDEERAEEAETDLEEETEAESA
jgi:large subunit ribosomal protein L31